MASSGARRERSVPMFRTFVGNVVALVNSGYGPFIVAEIGGAWLGTIMCWASSYEASVVEWHFCVSLERSCSYLGAFRVP
jgi:hypothetical protein